MNETIKEALEIGLNAVLNQGWTRSQEKEASLIQKALATLEAEKLESDPIYVPDAWEKAAESYHKQRCSKCKALPEDDVSEREA